MAVAYYLRFVRKGGKTEEEEQAGVEWPSAENDQESGHENLHQSKIVKDRRSSFLPDSNGPDPKEVSNEKDDDEFSWLSQETGLSGLVPDLGIRTPTSNRDLRATANSDVVRQHVVSKAMAGRFQPNSEPSEP